MISRMVFCVWWLLVKWFLKVGVKSDVFVRCFVIMIVIVMLKFMGVGYVFLVLEFVWCCGGRCLN